MAIRADNPNTTIDTLYIFEFFILYYDYLYYKERKNRILIFYGHTRNYIFFDVIIITY